MQREARSVKSEVGSVECKVCSTKYGIRYCKARRTKCEACSVRGTSRSVWRIVRNPLHTTCHSLLTIDNRRSACRGFNPRWALQLASLSLGQWAVPLARLHLTTCTLHFIAPYSMHLPIVCTSYFSLHALCFTLHASHFVPTL